MEKQEIIKTVKFKAELGFTTTEQRSRIMKKIKSSDTKSEIRLRKSIWGKGIRYRVNVKTLPGSPDIVIKKYKLVIFVDGEFWHGYKWNEKRMKIKSNKDFWIPKIERNMQRDLENNEALTKSGWIVLRFWENQVRKDLEGCLDTICRVIKS